MSRRSGYRRRWGRWQPSEAQRRVLDGLAQSSTNAEIAATLGLSAETVKWHVSELLGETGLEDRQALAEWWQQERERRPALGIAPAVWSRWAYAGLAAVVAGAAIILLVVTGGSGGGEPDAMPAGADVGPAATPTASAQEAGAPQSCDPPEQIDLRLVQPQELEAEGLVSAGVLLDAEYCPIYAANRTDRTFVWVGGTATIDLDGLDGWEYAQGSDKGVDFGQGTPFTNMRLLEVVPVGLGQELTQAGMSVDEAQGTATTLQTNGEGGYLVVVLEDSGFRRVALASNGELFVSPRGVPDSIAVNFNTGEPIDVSGMRRIGSLPTDERARTECEGTTCLARITVRGSDIPWPTGGQMGCPETATAFAAGIRDFELDAGSYVLELRAVDPNQVGPPGPVPRTPGQPWQCEEESVSPGDPMPLPPEVALLEIQARGSDRSPLSVVAAYDGTLYVGEVRLEHTCELLEYC